MRDVIAFLATASVVLSTGCGRPPDRTDTATPDTVRRWEGFVSTVDSVRLFARVIGSGSDTIIVLHGGPGFTLDYLAPDLEPLASRHTLVFYDQRGTGRSTLVSDSIGLSAARFVEDLEAIRAHFGLSKPTLLGHSWGVGLAALYAQRYASGIGQLILVDGIPLRRVDLIAGFEAMAQARDSTERAEMDRWMVTRRAHPEDAAACQAYYRLWFRPFFADPAALSRSRGDFCAGTTESRRNKLQGVDRFTMASIGNWDWRGVMASLPLRTLIIHGTEDPIPLATAEEWAVTLPNARLLTLPNVGHFPYLEAPDRFFAAIDTFLAGTWPAEAKPRRLNP
ncbi:MAG: alpha/beta fold hydrolase [Gemmatimonadota bacterium]